MGCDCGDIYEIDSFEIYIMFMTDGEIKLTLKIQKECVFEIKEGLKFNVPVVWYLLRSKYSQWGEKKTSLWYEMHVEYIHFIYGETTHSISC